MMKGKHYIMLADIICDIISNESNYDSYGSKDLRFKTGKLGYSKKDMMRIVKKDTIVLNNKEYSLKSDIVSHIKENYIYGSHKVGKIKFDIEINGVEKIPTIINVSSSLNTFKQILLPSVESKFR